MKYLIVNADDFGFTRDVNEGIVAAHRDGILTATTLMATGDAFDHAVKLAQMIPSLDVGCHLVLVGETGYPSTIPRLMHALAHKRLSPYKEFAAQVRRIVAAGIRPTHLDTHKHTHLIPAVLDAVIRISVEFGIPWVRRPFDLPIHTGGIAWRTRLVNRCVGSFRARFHRRLANSGCITTDHFAGFQLTGNYGPAELSRLITTLPDGVTEFMCHPGYCTEELLRAKTRLKESRERELEALTSPEVRKAVIESGFRLTSYRSLTTEAP